MPERLYKTGEVMITHSALLLLNALQDFPRCTAPSINAWARAAKALGTGHRIVHGEGNVRKAMRRLSGYWVIRRRFGRYVMVELSPRGKEIVNRTVPVRVIGRGPYISLATLGRR